MLFKVKASFLILSLLTFSLIIFGPLTNSINAGGDDINIETQQVNPGSFYYNFKRLWEKGRELLLFSNESKRIYYKSLLLKRMAELKHVAENKILSEIQRATERFAFQAGKLTELVEKGGSSEKEELTREFKKYEKILIELRDKYQANSSYWMLIQHDLNTLNILSDRLK